MREEPFRLMFPAGILAAVVGVLLWPFFVWDWLPFYPGVAHARVMIGGFFGAMIIGFLGTAGPRMLGARFLSSFELWTLFGLWGVAVVAALGNRLAIADGLTCLAFLFGFRCAAIRFPSRDALPPPGFAMVIVGLFSGFVGSALNFGLSLGLDWLPAPYALGALGNLLFYQAFILLPILGVAPFFFPRFGGLPSPQASLPNFRDPTREWSIRAAIAAAFAVALVATFVWEAFGSARWAGIVRSVMAAGFIVWQVPLRFKAGQVGTLGRVVQIAVVLLVLGLLLPALFPAHRLALLHVLFIGGFNVITLAVANWVIFGHSGAGPKGRAKLAYVRWGCGVILFALATRLSADFFPQVRTSHLAYAALAWVVGMAIWSWKILPRVRLAD